jgi:hypothetical protein
MHLHRVRCIVDIMLARAVEMKLSHGIGFIAEGGCAIDSHLDGSSQVLQKPVLYGDVHVESITGAWCRLGRLDIDGRLLFTPGTEDVLRTQAEPIQRPIGRPIPEVGYCDLIWGSNVERRAICAGG